MRGTIGSSQTLEQHVSGLLSVIYEASQPQPSLCSRDAGGVSLLKMLFHFLLDLWLSGCIKELHLDRESAIHDGLSLYTLEALYKICVPRISQTVMSYSLFPGINSTFALKQKPPPPHTHRSKTLLLIDLLCAWEDKSKSYSPPSSSHATHNIQMNSSINSLQLHRQRRATVQSCPISLQRKHTEVADATFMSVSRQPGLWFPESISMVQYQMLFLLIELYSRVDTLWAKTFWTWVHWKGKQGSYYNFRKQNIKTNFIDACWLIKMLIICTLCAKSNWLWLAKKKKTQPGISVDT